MADKETSSKDYKAENIKVLEGLEGVRLRPAMYIGSTSKAGLHHLVYEIVDNAVDEAMGGYCDLIEVSLNKDGSVTVTDNGRGIPVDMHPVYKRPAVEIAVTKLHAGGKFDKSSYKVSGGLHGVGISVVAALSKLMRVTIRKGGKIYKQEYKIGKPFSDLKVIGECEKKDTGTEVTFYSNKNKLNKDENFTGEDVREGLTAIISVKVPEPQFEGQTKTKLGNNEVKGIVDSVTMNSLLMFFEENPTIARRIVDKAMEAQKARNAAKKAKELVRRKNAFSFGGLPGKLADCSSNKKEESELFIVEGDSAGGSGKMARNKEYQAILPIKGKILNVEKANAVKVLSNEEIANLITAIGTGITDQFDLERLRYGKLVIMTDADVDGAHIRTLLLTFFFRFIPKIIENGNLYIAVPPLYRVRRRGDHYVYSDEELKKIISKLGNNIDVQRFKGLGEMNADQLWETTMNPKTRMLKKVTIDDAALANETFSKLMGDDVEPRRQFIAERAHEAQIDI